MAPKLCEPFDMMGSRLSRVLLPHLLLVSALAASCGSSSENPPSEPAQSGSQAVAAGGDNEVASGGSVATGGASVSGPTQGGEDQGGDEGEGGTIATGGGGSEAGAPTSGGSAGSSSAVSSGGGSVEPCTWKSPGAASLAGKYAAHFPIGTAIRAWDVQNQAQILRNDFNHLTAENAMKAADIHPTEATFEWAEADAIANFARQHCMKMTGHALLWHRQAPAWMFKGIVAEDPASLETLKSRLRAHIEAVVARYADVVDNWDVVNEAISDTDAKVYRDGAEGSKWFELFGNHSYIYWAFVYARDALEAHEPGSSKGKLYYNEYVLTKKADKVLKMLAWLKGKGITVDGVGFQSHEQLAWPAVADLQAAFDKFSAAGYKVKISELDVTVYADYATGPFVPEPEVAFTPALEATQAKRFANLFALYRKNKALITSVTIWGISDDRTWLDNEPVVGRDDYPLLFNDAHEPKAARSSIMTF
jgi:endo-1,4-beta-xylanase